MIKIITEKEFKTLIDMWQAARNANADAAELIGEYIVPGCGGFTAVDNSGGDCFVEEFPSMCEAMGWLKDKDMPPPVPKDDKHDKDGKDDKYGSGNELSVDGLYFEFCEGFKNRTLRVCCQDPMYGIVRDRYEHETGKSSYWWDAGLTMTDKLPRPCNDFEPENYTAEFWEWLQNILREGEEFGIKDVDGLSSFVLGWCASRKKVENKIREILG